MTDPAATYTSYLRIDDLLGLQQPKTAEDGDVEHDEMLFIVIHQVYELWFKQILWELDHAIELLNADERTRAAHGLNRVLRILKVLVGQLDVLETMTPMEFLSFRDRLDSASGFQSVQFRELEAVLGLLDENAPPSDPAVARRLERPGLWDALLDHLARTGHASVAATDQTAVRAVLVGVYRQDPSGAELCERFVDLDEGLQEWRYRHVQMVRRTIGTRGGTGGSDGAEYLASTIRQAFPDLWAIRTEL
ncbi:MAG: tryptophan 2,3-dioxygenase [Acidimicrobiales bacterium]